MKNKLHKTLLSIIEMIVEVEEEEEDPISYKKNKKKLRLTDTDVEIIEVLLKNENSFLSASQINSLIKEKNGESYNKPTSDLCTYLSRCILKGYLDVKEEVGEFDKRIKQSYRVSELGQVALNILNGSSKPDMEYITKTILKAV